MTRSKRFALSLPRATAITLALSAFIGLAFAQPGNFPITPQQRSTAQKVAQDGIPLSELSATAPDQYTVKSGDTLWDISKLYLTSPWRWPELWGMNLDQIRNPHLIYPGQMLFLDKSNGRARLRVGEPVGAGGRLSPRVRSGDLLRDGIPSISLAQIEPFLNEAVVFDNNELDNSPRIVSAQDGRVLLSRGDLAYVRGNLDNNRSFRVFREPAPLVDPTTREVLGYEGVFLGTAEYLRKGESVSPITKRDEIIPDTFTISSVRQEIRAGDRLSPTPGREFINFVPHAPQGEMAGQIIAVYGEALNAGQNQIVSLNRGSRDGMERGHVLALWRNGNHIIDTTDPKRPTIKLPDERHGSLFVFKVFNRVSYALILNVKEPVGKGDRFTQP
ncbi:MAG: hypothetical protein RLZZ618_1634 [Pseudomonadota bacterium]|jgi:hypothetical protein